MKARRKRWEDHLVNNNYRRRAALSAYAISIATCVMMASCAAPRTAPQQVAASNPTVTYKYRNDDELMQANDRAAEFCTQYQAIAQTSSFGEDRDGGRYVIFECMATLPPGQRPFDPNLAYTFRTDRELTDASRNAQVYCRDTTGSSQVSANISNSPNGTKTVRFQCRRPR